ncbi:helix-turn-helix domain-containing protein [Acetoanaerobium noterae]|uniref:helix-turn-helix domain-containing protein n=1 Tax=Acetoanaerobium noterae TaxID=745369 RepID=UPI0033416B9C
MAKGKYQEWLTSEGLLKLEAWARNGLTEKQIAHNIGITEQTLNVWKKSYPSFSESLKKGKEVIDIQVENALLKRALGYQYTERTKERLFDEETGQYVLEITKEVTKEVQPDTTAQIFWLKNRKPQEWRDKKETELSGNIKTNPFDELTPDELRKLIKDG